MQCGILPPQKGLFFHWATSITYPVIKPLTQLDFPVANVLFLLLGAAIAAYYYSGLRTRELAVAAARSHCVTLQLQLLDQSVSLRSTKIHADRKTLLAVQRDYEFEFTATGEERYSGKICMLNKTPKTIWLQPHRLPDNQPVKDSSP